MAIVLIFDCGATNVRVIALDSKGGIIASSFVANNTSDDPNYPKKAYKIWDFEQILAKLTDCALDVISKLGQAKDDVKAIAVTTFGVDGAPFYQGKQLYPIISWQCPRTLEIIEKAKQELDLAKFYQTNGVSDFSFNTLFKLYWLRENEPEIYQKMDKFHFISSMINQRLTGVESCDFTMAGTSMLTDLKSCDFSTQMLDKLGLSRDHFAPMVMAGEVIANLNNEFCEKLKLSSAVKVISCGHDTQFALIGSGAGKDQAVLSSGTWEILSARVSSIDINLLQDTNLSVEFDAVKGWFNPSLLWLSGAVNEWVIKQFFALEKSQKSVAAEFYASIIEQASKVPALSNGVLFKGDFNNQSAFIENLSIHTDKYEIYRSSLEFMAFQLKKSLQILRQTSQISDLPLILVGGGSKNSLANQIRADVLAQDVAVVEVNEATVLGAAICVFHALGYFTSLEQAQDSLKPNSKIISPSSNTAIYNKFLNKD